MSRALYFDCETVGRASCRALLKPDKRLKDAAKIAADLEEKAGRMALNPNFADLACLGYAINDDPPILWACADDDDRREGLELFWRLWAIGAVRVGFNSLRYDLPVLIRQSQLLGVAFPKDISLNKYRADSLDLMHMLTFEGTIEPLSLVNYCLLFGREETVEDGTGGDVAAWVAAGDWDAVRQHCAEDVERTRWLAKRLGVVA